MKRALFCILVFVSPVFVFAQAYNSQEGTIVRMRMSECLGPQHAFMATMSGGRAKADPSLLCPEYVLVADKVVYVISGKSSEQLIPLAETTRFRMQKRELLIRVDDANKESHFHIKAMVLRPEWERNQMLQEAEASAMIAHHLDPATMREQQ